MNYHAHVYWKNQAEREIAISLRESLHNLGCPLGRVFDIPIGPHPLAMYQVIYNSSNSELVENLLTTKSGGISILLHEDTGDDIHDHTDGVRWIGDSLPLDIEWLEEYVKSKEHE